jgi:hypothetical protein
MDGLDRLDLFRLGEHGDRHEREFWPLLAKLFPSYEILWRRLIVPLTCRVDPKLAASPEHWIRLRPGIPPGYEQVSMANYSVFYFLGRAVKRRAEEKTALEYPEDVLFLLDSVGDNLKHFRCAMNDLASDCGRVVFNSPREEAPPFKEISAYRDIFLHNPVIGRGVGVEKTYIPKWSANKSASPLERAKTSWRAAEQLPQADRIGTDELLDRLIREVGLTLESCWQTALSEVIREPFLQMMVKVTGLAEYLPVQGPAAPVEWAPPSGMYSSLGSNTTFAVPSASGNYSANRTENE